MESTFHTFAAGNFAHDKVAVQTTVAAGNYYTFISLQTAAVALDYADMHDNGVAGREFRDGFTQAGNFFLFQLLNQIHCLFPKSNGIACCSCSISCKRRASCGIKLRLASKSGRRAKVRCNDCFSRHRAIKP